MNSALYIAWNEKNETGIPIIDEQHRAIVSLINSLCFFKQENLAKVALTPTLTVLSQYSRIHFSTEESLLKKANYVDFDDHQLLHQNLLKETEIVRLRSEDENNPDILLEFLKNWWLNHINMEDRKYMEAVKRLFRLGD